MSKTVSRVRERVLYAETYRAGSACVVPNRLPTLRHVTDGFELVECELRKAGVVERSDGTKLEFQDLRIYLRESADTGAEQP